MRFSAATFSTTALAVISAVSAQLTPQQIIGDINTLTSNTNLISTLVSNSNVGNLLQNFFVQGPTNIVGQISSLSTIVTVDTDLFESDPPSTADSTDSLNIASAFEQLVTSQQELLGNLISKSGFLSQIPIAGPAIAVLLGAFQSDLDAFAKQLSVIAPSQSTAITSQIQSFDSTVKNVISYLG